MKLRSLAPWYGAKRAMADVICKTLGRHRAYWELFCGSAAVLFAKRPASHETINDLHSDLTNLAWVVQSDRWAELADRVERSVMAEELYQAAESKLAEAFDSGPDIGPAAADRAYWFLVRSWWGRNGMAGIRGRSGSGLAVRFTSGGGHGGVRWRSVGESLPAWHARLKPVVILRRDAFEILDSIKDQPGTAIYLDPPYLAKSAKYVHDFDDQDHDRLAASVNRFQRARVIVSYYDHPRLSELYGGWVKLDCARLKNMAQAGEFAPAPGVASVAPEVLLVNGGVTRELF